MVHRRGVRGRLLWSAPPVPRGDGDEDADSDWLNSGDPAYAHIMAAAHLLASFHVDLPREELERLAVAKGRADFEKDPRSPVRQALARRYTASPIDPAKELQLGGSVVYYMRIGNRVKIGWSAGVLKRVSAINPEELMAVEPGGRPQEAMRHAEFRSLRTHGEWFRLESPLTDHIAALQERSQRRT
jgi:hypothetical protein